MADCSSTGSGSMRRVCSPTRRTGPDFTLLQSLTRVGCSSPQSGCSLPCCCPTVTLPGQASKALPVEVAMSLHVSGPRQTLRVCFEGLGSCLLALDRSGPRWRSRVSNRVRCAHSKVIGGGIKTCRWRRRHRRPSRYCASPKASCRPTTTVQNYRRRRQHSHHRLRQIPRPMAPRPASGRPMLNRRIPCPTWHHLASQTAPCRPSRPEGTSPGGQRAGPSPLGAVC